jgi:hypothetical protein
VRAKKDKNTLSILSLISLGLFFSSLSLTLFGCATTQTETAAVYRSKTAGWIDGKVAQDVDAPLSKVIQVASLALRALELNITKTDIREDAAQIIGEYIDNKTIWIDLRSISELSTRLEIRVSVKGNKEASYRILKKIQEYL